MTAFGGFPEETISFLANLKKNNRKDWFDANRAVYQSAVKLPAEIFCEAMVDELRKLTGENYRSRIFRIHRDLRFSKDKSPYNTHLHISFLPNGENPPAWLFGLEPGRLSLGCGCFDLAKGQLERFRERIAAAEGDVLVQALTGLSKKGYRTSDPELKKPPVPFPADHRRADLLRRKSLTVFREYSDVKSVLGPGAVATCLRHYKELRPIFDWLGDLG